MPKFDWLSLGSIYLDINGLNFPFGEGLKPETETVGSEYQTQLGGSAVISARVAAGLGLKPVFIGQTGEDWASRFLAQLMSETGITPAINQDPNLQTNLGLNYVGPTGQTILTVVGTANQALSPQVVRQQVLEYLPSIQYWYVGAYFKLPFLSEILPELVTIAQHQGVKVVLDHGVLMRGVPESTVKKLQKLVGQVDYYLPSEVEFEAVWHLPPTLDGLKTFFDQTATPVVLKLGPSGVISIDKTGTTYQQPSFPVKLYNTIGAGDSFNAGFVKALTDQRPWQEALKYGCATAALKISRPELPSHTQVMKMIESTL